MALKFRNISNPRPRSTTCVSWICGAGKSITLSPYAFAKKLIYLISHPTLNIYAQNHPSADAYGSRTLQDFVGMIAYGIDGDYGDSEASRKTVLQY